MPYRGRLAPSPTGALHLGHARTFLVGWLRARQAKGAVVLRIEDLDPPRVVPGAADAIQRDLDWLGLTWDEGPGDQGGPYFQSERFPHYEAALRRLEELGTVFPCACSRKQIAAIASAPHGAAELGPRYPGTCRPSSMEPRAPGSTPPGMAVRFAMSEPPPTLRDGFFGEVATEAWGGDFVVRRADGLWSYQLAVVVDDAAMGITEVVRGADLLSSTPRQLALYRALGCTPPRFVHVPLVVGEGGERLAKRDRAASLGELREAGASRAEVLGLLARSLGIDMKPQEPAELLGAFDLARLPRGSLALSPSGRWGHDA